ncbi:MAG: TIGR02281 family clan AA aspartic protease [Alphaproteobacteria bacterium]|nr:TIGR02281 family clan AA aspartic protease [Alphaproteobacteria bacterium]
MADDNGPWQRNTGNRRSRPPLGLIVWIGLLLVVGAGIWFLDDLFPGQLSTEDDSDLHIIRSVGVLALISSGLIFARQINLGEAVRNISIWIGLAAILFVGYSFRTEIEDVYFRVRGELVPSQAIALTDDELVITASADGHFYVDGRANGERIRFMVDTGASHVTLSPRDASRIGVNLGALQFDQRFQTANGVGYGSPYRLDSMSIGTIEFGDTEVSINEADMSTSLLGMSVLERLTSFEFRDGKLYLRR